MGEVSETMTKKKKKGRPSLLDLQKRSLKKQQQQQQQQQQQNQRHAVSRNAKNGTIVDDDDDERKQKKHKLLVGLNPHLQHHSHHATAALSPSNSLPSGDPDDAATRKRRRIDASFHGSDEADGKLPKATDSKHGSQGESGPTTPLPDKKLLLFILDRLQKKDTHGVFSEPVDPEELPDYHDIIRHPMDFGTVRKKLDGGLYTNLDQFESDVLLICSNAMQYNSPDTIYYRQARAMQEIARKDFENLRQDSDDSEPQPKIVQRGRPPGKHNRKSLAMSPAERIAPESSSDATLASVGDIASGSNGYNLRKVLSKFQPADSSTRASHNNFNSGGTSWTSEWENEFPASVLKAVLRYGKKQFAVDETRRDTYNCPVPSRNEPPVLTTVEDEFKQLLAVGLHAKHSYARSLAHFAADLGPVVWKIASQKISSVLPKGHEFGPGWVSEDEVSERQNLPVCDEERTSDPCLPEDHRSNFSSSSGSFLVSNRSCLQGGEMVINRELNYQSELNPLSRASGGMESMVPMRIQQELMAHSDDFGSAGRLCSNVSSQMKMVRLADLTGSSSSVGNAPQMLDTDHINSLPSHTAPTIINQPLKAQVLNKFSQLDSSNLMARESGFEPQSSSQGYAGKASWPGMEVPIRHNSISLGTSNSSSSNMETGSQLHPNLALQL
ncbi:uncharacterized protein LOC130946277 isoform X1 [Arachis stenosperma]|uniref:uncharacterized protein LOC130946277 isoform X1 n=1 Tax=Arachis stenosperma TaxID=217475 RepID=UPI0025AC678B|nr:uncharacterized protein LOC130946277 isoform X1 [Arachis stenosperma]